MGKKLKKLKYNVEMNKLFLHFDSNALHFLLQLQGENELTKTMQSINNITHEKKGNSKEETIVLFVSFWSFSLFIHTLGLL